MNAYMNCKCFKPNLRRKWGMMSEKFQDYWLNQETFILNNGLDANSVGYQGSKLNLATLALLENGIILNSNEAGGVLLGCEPDDLKWQPVSRLFPMLKEISLMLDGKINPYLKFLSTVGHRFEAVGMNEVGFRCELFFFVVEDSNRSCLQISMQPVRRQATLSS